MTWYTQLKTDGKEVYVWSEEFPGHHKITLEFDPLDLRTQLRLVEAENKVT